MKHLLLATSAFAAVFFGISNGVGTPQQCALFVIDNCPDIPGSLIEELIVNDEEDCRLDCETIFPTCQMFIFNNDPAADHNCALYEYDVQRYINECKFVGGVDPEPWIDDCFNTTDPCNDYRDSNCDIQGEEIQSIDLLDLLTCETFCHNDALCEYFTYQSEDLTCTTYSNVQKECINKVGPKQPSLENAC